MIDHPNLIKYYEAYEDEKYIHIVMELCTGGDLLEKIMNLGSIDEQRVCVIMKKLFLAVNHLHGMGICHRDLKPENCLFVEKDSVSEIKIIDFGLSIKRVDVTTMASFVGTPYYVAPEIIAGRYGMECDVWSLGVVMFVLLSGVQPFDGLGLYHVLKKISTGDYTFDPVLWQPVSSTAKDLVSRMLTVSPAKRITLLEALSHPWFQVADTPALPMRVLTDIKKYKAPKKLQKEVMKIMIKFMSVQDIEELRASFIELDQEHTGFITVSDLQKVMRKAGFDLPLDEITSKAYPDIVKSMDSANLGMIKYSDFLVATIDKKKLVDEELLFLTFQHFDSDNDGFISVQNLKNALETVGDPSSMEDIEAMLTEWDTDHNRRIDFNEFRVMIESFTEPLSAASAHSIKRKATAHKTFALITAPLD
jgi:calcium-dependent protein kinase